MSIRIEIQWVNTSPEHWGEDEENPLKEDEKLWWDSVEGRYAIEPNFDYRPDDVNYEHAYVRSVTLRDRVSGREVEYMSTADAKEAAREKSQRRINRQLS